MSVAITRRELSAREVRGAAARLKDAKAARRLLAIALVMEGRGRGEAARAAGMDRQTLRDWVHRYNAEGVAGLSNRRPAGREPRLNEKQRSALARLVEKGPDPKTDGVVRWRRVDLKKKIKELFGVDLHEHSVGKVLRKLGYVRLSTRPEHPKSSPKAQAAFKKTSPERFAQAFPPGPGASRLKSGSRMKPASVSKER